MGLQVWLPLNGNLENKGLGKINNIQGTPSYRANGKIGSALELNTKITISSSQLANLSTFTLCFWVNVNSSTSLTTNWTDIIGFNNISSTGTQGVFRCETCYNRTDWEGVHWHDNNVNAMLGSKISGTEIHTKNDDIWCHCVLVCNNKISKISFYTNGELTGEFVHNGGTINSTGTFYLGDTNNIVGAINDVRFYDEALSPMQVKLISQGLVAHYLLNNNGNGQENLLRNSYCVDGSDTQQKYGWELNGYGAPEIVNKDGFLCIHLQASCTGKSIPSIKSANKIILENGTEYTISCDLMFDKEIRINGNVPIHYHNGSSSTTNEFNFTNVNNGKGFTLKSINPTTNTIIPANTWQHYEEHIVAVSTPADSSLPYSTYRAFIYGSVRTVSETTTVNMWLKNWKIEKGAVSTSWCPNSSDEMAINLGYNNNIEYDISGYCHNGTKYNITDYTSDTPRYSLATKFNGTNSYINVGRGGMVKDEITINIWAYMEDWSTYNYRLISCTKSGGWNFEGSSTTFHFVMGTGTTSNSYKSTANYDISTLSSGWHMFTGTYDGFTIKLYIDGEFKTKKDAYTTKTPIYYNDIAPILIGAEANQTQTSAGYYFKGYISDVRIYATALSESDLQSLYNNSGFLDSSGNIYATEYTEL